MNNDSVSPIKKYEGLLLHVAQPWQGNRLSHYKIAYGILYHMSKFYTFEPVMIEVTEEWFFDQKINVRFFHDV